MQAPPADSREVDVLPLWLADQTLENETWKVEFQLYKHEVLD